MWCYLVEKYLPEDLALTDRQESSHRFHKHLFFSWHGLKITLYLLLTIKCPTQPSSVSYFIWQKVTIIWQKINVWQKINPTCLLQLISTPVRALCNSTPGEKFRTGIRAFLHRQGRWRREKLSDLSLMWRVEDSAWKPHGGPSTSLRKNLYYVPPSTYHI